MNLQMFLAIASMELRKIMSYRFDFWFNYMLGLLVRFGINYFIFKAIFDSSGSKTIGGFDFVSMNLFLLLAFCCRKIVINNAEGFINDDIYTGGINRYLIQPVSLFGFKYASHLAAGFMSFVQSIFALGLYVSVFGLQPFYGLSSTGALVAMFAVLLASLSYFFVAMMIDTIAFYAEHIWSLHVLFRFLFEFGGGLLLPLSLFPPNIAAVLKMSPLYFMAAFPVDCLFGKLSNLQMMQGLLTSLAWCAVFFVLSKLAFKVGLKRYSGIGM